MLGRVMSADVEIGKQDVTGMVRGQIKPRGPRGSNLKHYFTGHL